MPAPGSWGERDDDYVQLDDRLYRPRVEVNESVRNEDGLYRLDLTLEQADPERALEDVSLHLDDTDVPSAVAAAARDGEASAHGGSAPPDTPIRTVDGEYFLVYTTGQEDPAPVEGLVEWVMTYFAPIVGGIELLAMARKRRSRTR